jgi:hypothetical protein
MDYIVNDNGTLGYLTFAKKFQGLIDILKNYNYEIGKPEHFRWHVSTHPFGFTAIYYYFWKFDNLFFPQWNYDPIVGYIPIVIGTISLIPLYKLTKSFFIVILFTLIPVFYFFAWLFSKQCSYLFNVYFALLILQKKHYYVAKNTLFYLTNFLISNHRIFNNQEKLIF